MRYRCALTGSELLCCRENLHLRLDAALLQFPVLLERLRGARAVTTDRRSVTVLRRLRSVFQGNTVLIEDLSVVR
jgi:hypothetical protein